jgi:hypothetical protein
VPCILHSYLDVLLLKFLKERVPEVGSVYRCENLTTKVSYLTPLEWLARIACDRTSSYQSLHLKEPLRPAVDVQVTHPIILLTSVVVQLLGAY